MRAGGLALTAPNGDEANGFCEAACEAEVASGLLADSCALTSVVSLVYTASTGSTDGC